VQFRIILEYLVQVFAPAVDYTEKEVNTLIKRFNEDTAGLRRDLVDAGLLGRLSNGSRYWRCPATNGNVEEGASTVLYPPDEQRIPNSIAEIDLRLLTDRLVIEQVKDDALPDEFLETFNSNPDFIENSELFTGKRAYDIADVKMYLQAETRRENSHCLAIRFQDTNKLVGTAALVAPHPNKPFPWIGLLLIDRKWQGRGLGAEAAHAIEDRLADAGWNEVHLGVMQANPGARRFWEKQGYLAYEETLDDNKRPVWLMRKSLASSVYPVARDTHE
jgi:RimJ/RimL family protein N-acetyltransferase